MHHCTAERCNGARAVVVGGDARALDACGRAASAHAPRRRAYITRTHRGARWHAAHTAPGTGPRLPLPARCGGATRVRQCARARATRAAPNKWGPRDRVGNRASLNARGAQPHAPRRRASLCASRARTRVARDSRIPRAAAAHHARNASNARCAAHAPRTRCPRCPRVAPAPRARCNAIARSQHTHTALRPMGSCWVPRVIA